MSDPITAIEAAEIIGIDPSMVRVYCRRAANGKPGLRAKLLGREWMIDRAVAVRFASVKRFRGRKPAVARAGK